jgi:RNA polymerase sigma-70 factor, ECF subfamily
MGTGIDIRAAIVGSPAMTDWPVEAPVSPSGDASLVEAARRGDRIAYGRLYGIYARMVHGILLARVPPAEVDDLVQDVFLQALPRLNSLRDSARFGAWLAAIARNRANDYYRRSKSAAEINDPIAAERIEDRAATSAEMAQAAAVLAAIRALPDAYREPLILRLVEGMTGPEIAERTGLTPGSVRVNLHRGMQQLREKLGAIPTKSQAANSAGESR